MPVLWLTHREYETRDSWRKGKLGASRVFYLFISLRTALVDQAQQMVSCSHPNTGDVSCGAMTCGGETDMSIDESDEPTMPPSPLPRPPMQLATCSIYAVMGTILAVSPSLEST